ncbi:MAG: OmpA family protein [Burkholderiaceae bacterium]
MNRVLSLFALLLLLLMLAGAAMLWLMPAATPAALAPLASWLQRTVGNDDGSSTRPATPAASSAAAAVYGRQSRDTVAADRVPAVPGGTAANIARGPAPIDLAGRSRVAKVEIDAQGNARVQPDPASETTRTGDQARADAADDPDTPPVFDPDAIPTEPSGGQLVIADPVPPADPPLVATMTAETRERVQAEAVRPDRQRAERLAAGPAASPVSQPAPAADLSPRAASAGSAADKPARRQPASVPASVPASAPAPALAAAGSVTAPSPVPATPAGATTRSGEAALADTGVIRQEPPTLRQELAASATERLVAREATVATAPASSSAPMAPRVLGRIESSETSEDPDARVASRAADLTPSAEPVAATQAPASLDGVVSPQNQARLASLVPPDAPAPPPARSAAGRRQDASIRNFLEGKVVEFVVGRDQLSERGKQALDALVPLIQSHRDTRIIIQGHTDSVGDDASNLALSGARALVARDYLIARGVDPTRLKAQALGERRPIASNRTAEGRVRNRRIDFLVTERDAGG